MSETPKLKTFFSPELVRRLAHDIEGVYEAFPTRVFVRDACVGLDALELLERGRHIERALAKHLPASYPEALDVLLRSLGAEHGSDEVLGSGMAPFFYLPHTMFVAERGLEHFDLSLRAQLELTKRFSAEASMRPYVARDPERAMTQLHEWATHPNAHVRRLVSECTRTRLPWAPRVAWLDANPERVLALLALLKDDPSSYVRRSVANNLNDLGKTRPELLLSTCSAWWKDAPADRRALIEHALRGAVKRGAPAVLALLGYGSKAAVAIEAVEITPKRVPIGKTAAIRFALRSKSRAPQELLVDFAVHFVKASGETAPKVFKLKRVTLPARGTAEFRATVSLRVHTTRKPRPGTHAVDVIVNGKALRVGSFVVVGSKSPR